MHLRTAIESAERRYNELVALIVLGIGMLWGTALTHSQPASGRSHPSHCDIASDPCGPATKPHVGE
jgi:hypothetical protein